MSVTGRASRMLHVGAAKAATKFMTCLEMPYVDRNVFAAGSPRRAIHKVYVPSAAGRALLDGRPQEADDLLPEATTPIAPDGFNAAMAEARQHIRPLRSYGNVVRSKYAAMEGKERAPFLGYEEVGVAAAAALYGILELSGDTLKRRRPKPPSEEMAPAVPRPGI
jgi:hypothetical protein